MRIGRLTYLATGQDDEEEPSPKKKASGPPAGEKGAKKSKA
jgi:hypothetical protein